MSMLLYRLTGGNHVKTGSFWLSEWRLADGQQDEPVAGRLPVAAQTLVLDRNGPGHDLLLAVLVDPQRHGCLGERLLQEQHSHHKVLGQRGQLPVEQDTEAHRVSKGSQHPEAGWALAPTPVNSQTCCRVVVESVQNLRTQLFEVLMQVLALQLDMQLHYQP